MHQNLDFSVVTPGDRTVRYGERSLNLYQRLIQYFTVVTDVQGEYLDLVNFNRRVYADVLSVADSERVFVPEHGYGAPDGSAELANLVCAYEESRIARFRRRHSAARPGGGRSSAAGIGFGATGVMNCLVPAVRDYWRGVRQPRTARVVLTLPLYSVYDGIVTAHGLEPIYLHTRATDGFLPRADDVARALAERPMAMILTFPTNPAQTTYGGDVGVDELCRIVELCQESGTFLLVDNVYQDTFWSGDRINPEVHALTGRCDYLVKVVSLSKDRPGFSGLRLGYWYGDPRLRESFFYYSSIQYNTPNSASRCLLALDLLFRIARLEERALVRADLTLLGEHVAGWSRPLDRGAVFGRIAECGLEAQYSAGLARVEALQADAGARLLHLVANCDAFSEVLNDEIGNVLLVRANPEFFPGSDHDLFLYILRECGVGILPANAFGFPVERGSAWFRITTIHDSAPRIAEAVERVADAVRRFGRGGARPESRLRREPLLVP